MVKRSAAIDEDHGYDQLMKKLDELESTPSNFYIGIFDSDLEQVIKAGVHEFGAPDSNIPSRKWLSSFFDEHSGELADIYQEAVTYWLEVGGVKRDVFQDFSEEVLVLLQGYLETNPLSPNLKPGTWKEKETDTMMMETSQMVSAIAIRYHSSKNKASGGDELIRMQDVSGVGPSPSTGGRPKSFNLLRNLKKIFTALKGPQLYEGYGFRKRAESKPLFSTTVRTPRGFSRASISDGPKQRGRYPSISRPR